MKSSLYAQTSTGGRPGAASALLVGKVPGGELTRRCGDALIAMIFDAQVDGSNLRAEPPFGKCDVMITPPNVFLPNTGSAENAAALCQVSQQIGWAPRDGGRPSIERRYETRPPTR